MYFVSGATVALNDLPIEIPDLQPGDEVIREVVPHNDATNDRSLARRLALQALYEIDSSKHAVGIVMNAQMRNYDPPVARPVANYIRRLVLGVIEHSEKIDVILHQYASEFPLAQIAIIDRNILRIAALEFAILGSTPIGVAIDEAVELAKLFGAEGSPRFVNGVLGTLADDKEVLATLTIALVPIPDETDDTPWDEDAGEVLS
ncbi:MAG: transcription antitermination factor NusB [Anaerolineae bacterium]|nr:transcription antitermination factor NusB [Anaerolineae bacterium]